MSIQQRALTIKSNGIANVLVSDVIITPPSLGQAPSDSTNIRVKGIWDTGATNSVINPVVVKNLGLRPIGVTQVNTASHAAVTANVYLVDVILPSNVVIPNLRVTEGSISNFDMLIGMDVINHGDFSVTNYNGKTTTTFRTPSCHEIDYVREISIKHLMARKQASINKYSPAKSSKRRKKKSRK